MAVKRADSSDITANKSIGNSVTEGVIWKQIMGLFLPILIGTFFQQFYNTVDMIVVGRFVGTEALAAVGGSSMQLINLILGFFIGLCAGAGVVISQGFGAKDMKTVQKGIQTATIFSMVGGIVIAVIGIMLTEPILMWMSTPLDTMADSKLYLQIYFGGIIFVFLYNMGSAILRALGNSKLPLYFLIVCSVVNIALDIILVVVFHMGVLGVALATVIAQAVSAVLVLITLLRADEGMRIDLKHPVIDGRILASQLRLGLPGGFTSVMYGLSNVIVQTAINPYGTTVTAAWGADAKIETFFWMINGAYGTAICTFVGQNYGAGKWDRVHKGTRVCLSMYIGTALVIGALYYVFAVPLYRIFTTDPEVIDIGVMVLRTVCPLYFFFAFIEVFSASLRGVSNVIIPLILTLFGVCVLRVCWIWFILPLAPSVKMIIRNYPVTWGVTALFFIIYYSMFRAKMRRKTGQ